MLSWDHCHMNPNCIALSLTQHYREGGYRVQRVRSRSTVPRADRLTEGPIENRDPSAITLPRTRLVTPSEEQMSASRAWNVRCAACVESQPERAQLRTAGYSERPDYTASRCHGLPIFPGVRKLRGNDPISRKAEPRDETGGMSIAQSAIHKCRQCQPCSRNYLVSFCLSRAPTQRPVHPVVKSRMFTR